MTILHAFIEIAIFASSYGYMEMFIMFFWDITYLILESRKVVLRFALDKLLLM